MSKPLQATLKFVQLQFGLFVFAVAITLMLEAKIGLDPWSAFHQGMAATTGLSFGTITQLTGLLLIASSWLLLGVRPGLGTVFNMLVIGPWIDLLRGLGWITAPDAYPPAVGMFVLGMIVLGFATALYIGARFGAGPRDGFTLGLSQRLGVSVRMTRIGVELTVLGTALLVGGKIGLGTLLFAVLMGPIMQAAMKLLRVPVSAHSKAKDPDTESGADSEPGPMATSQNN